MFVFRWQNFLKLKNNFLIGLSIDGPKEIHDNGTSL